MISKSKGFTLIELLIVIGILAILMGVIVVAINPARQFAQARNAQRWAHVNTILSGVYQRIVDNDGSWAEGAICDALPATAQYITSTDGANNVDLCACLVATYMASLPYDPSASGAAYSSCTSYTTGYTILKDSTTGRITVAAPSAEIGETITVTR